MLELAQNSLLAQITEQIDELSTRLILDGSPALTAADFERLAQAAGQACLVQLNDCALRLAASVAAAPAPPAPELTRLVGAGLEELRRLLGEAPVPLPEVSQGTLDKAGPAESQPTVSEPKALAADEELIREFVTESSEHLATIESQLLILEKDNSATETLNAIFRGFHTIKGLAGFLEFASIQSLTHEVETLLDLARTAQIAITPSTVDVLLECTDVVRRELGAITRRLSGEALPPSTVDPALLDRVRLAARANPSPGEDADSPGPQTAPPAAPQPPQPATAAGLGPSVEGLLAEPARAERRPGSQSSVRIDTAKLDQLMDMVGEMVIAQTFIQHSSILESVKDPTLQRNLAQLARTTADVQRITTGMRMVPIGLQFNKTARLVRDLARRARKQIVFESSGEDTEVDKTIAEQIADPLLHMVRNSIDHGIESAEERVASGKDPVGHIRVSAYHQAGQIVVAVADDGRGLDREKILAKARQNGLIDPGASLPDNEIYLLIFEPGFSTAAKVTDISGRGVGMDVVRKHVQKLRGRIDIQTRAGEGTTFYVKLPLTLAIIEGLVVASGQQRYIVPIFSVKEILRPAQEMLSTVQGTGEMALVRGRLLPIVRLHRRFAIEPRSTRLTDGILIVTESEERAFCLFVDDLLGKQEVVIKSLGRRFKDVAGVAGCAILGDGRVGLILDIDGIYKGRI